VARPLRIVHVTAYFAPAYAFGGPPRSLLALCRAQQAAGLDIEVFTTTANRGAPLPAAPGGRDMEGVRTRYFPVSTPAFLLGAASMTPPLAAALTTADVVHIHGLFNRTVWLASRAAHAAAVTTIVSPRGMLEPAALAYHQWRKRATWMVNDRRVMQRADAWHATSEMESRTLGRLSPARRIIEIPNAVDDVVVAPGDVQDARARAGVPPGARYVLFLGRLHPIKRLDLFGEACAMLSDLPDLHVVIAGPDERGHRAVVQGRFAPLRDRVHWIGEVDRRTKNGLLTGAAVLVSCSNSESFGMSVAEAMLASVPVVVTRTCPWSLVETARCGQWVAQSAAAIAAALRGVLLNPEDGRRQGERGRVVALHEYGPAAIGARWRDAYESLR
jgi:glycosyltransferase involved in cell wall biosynthesis